MNGSLTRSARKTRVLLASLIGMTIPAGITAQQTYEACYVPGVGAIYLIKQADLPAACLAEGHIAFRWTDGAAADGEITTAKLADGSVVTVKLADAAVTAVKLAAAAVGPAALADGAVSEAKLAFDAVTQAELDAHTGADDHGRYLLVDGLREATDGFAVSGTLGAGAIPATGEGLRLMWYAGKAAFRAGRAVTTRWDDPYVGAYSTAFGVGTTASGEASSALGAQSSAGGDRATTMGYATVANGDQAVAMGSSTAAWGNSSVAAGVGTTAQAYASVVIGRFNEVAGSQASWVGTDPLFVAGNGELVSPSNALTLYKDGNLTIAGSLTESSDIRLKEGVERVETALPGVLALTPIRYRFRAGTGHPADRQIGLSAQEVAALFPELVRRDSRGYLSVAYGDLSAVLVRALQEQQETLESLRERVARLEALVADLSAGSAAGPRR